VLGSQIWRNPKSVSLRKNLPSADPHRHFLVPLAFPLIEAICRNQITLRRSEPLVRWSFPQCLCTGIYQPLPDGLIVGPRRHETPAHRLQYVAFFITHNHRHLLRRRNVIARRKGEITLDFKEVLSSGLERGAKSPYIDFMQLLQGGDVDRRSVGVGPELLTYSLLVMLRKKSEKNRDQG